MRANRPRDGPGFLQQETVLVANRVTSMKCRLSWVEWCPPQRCVQILTPIPGPASQWVFSCVWLSATPWTGAHQDKFLCSMEFSRQEYRIGLPFPSPGDIPKPGIEPRSPTLQADSLQAELSGEPGNIITQMSKLSHKIFRRKYRRNSLWLGESKDFLERTHMQRTNHMKIW